ncbi:hypothetical protein [Herpetosiphon gulosus]|uniref:J domain-containing protein n=1 Tax=Herpetosiphon gulosus TaxID=1973496 RepID=A0ABP9X115_9CHLR
MSKQSKIYERIDNDQQNAQYTEKGFDSRANPLTELDQRRLKEHSKYLGLRSAKRGESSGNPLILIGLAGLLLIIGIMLWPKVNSIFLLPLYCGSILFISLGLIIVLGLRNAFQETLAERRYLKQRAALIKTYGSAIQPSSLKGLSYNYPKSSRSEAETRFHELQKAHYHDPKRNQAYHAEIQRLIDHAPEADRHYLSELDRLERSWVKERYEYLTFDPESNSYTTPTMGAAWMILIGGIGMLGAAVVMLFQGKSLMHSSFIGFFGLILVGGFSSVYKQGHSLAQAEQRYFAERQRISQDHGR